MTKAPDFPGLSARDAMRAAAAYKATGFPIWRDEQGRLLAAATLSPKPLYTLKKLRSDA